MEPEATDGLFLIRPPVPVPIHAQLPPDRCCRRQSCVTCGINIIFFAFPCVTARASLHMHDHVTPAHAHAQSLPGAQCCSWGYRPIGYRQLQLWMAWRTAAGGPTTSHPGICEDHPHKSTARIPFETRQSLGSPIPQTVQARVLLRIEPKAQRFASHTTELLTRDMLPPPPCERSRSFG